jgi:hypothetical protein
MQIKIVDKKQFSQKGELKIFDIALILNHKKPKGNSKMICKNNLASKEFSHPIFIFKMT